MYSTVKAKRGILLKFKKKNGLSKYKYFMLPAKNIIESETYLRSIVKIIKIVITLIFLGKNFVVNNPLINNKNTRSSKEA
jgi:hypothetical protein